MPKELAVFWQNESILWNIDIIEHCVFDFTEHEPWQQCESHKCYKVEPSINDWETVENCYLIKHEIVSQGEEP